jgi:hypothetical protein
MSKIKVGLVLNMIYETLMSALLAYRNISTPSRHSPETKENIIIKSIYRLLTMVYSTQNNCVLGIFHRPMILAVETRRFGNDLCASSDEGGKRHPLSCAP